MPLSIYIDNNVWDLLFEKKIDLSIELPREEFCLCLTKEAEFEIPPIPDEKAELKKFIYDTIVKCSIETRPYFGFSDEKHPISEQRVAGFDEGFLADLAETQFMEQQKTRLSKHKKESTKLYKNEADISVAARSFGAVVITLDKKNGPINDAYKHGGAIVYLHEFIESGLPLKDFIMSKFQPS